MAYWYRECASTYFDESAKVACENYSVGGAGTDMEYAGITLFGDMGELQQGVGNLSAFVIDSTMALWNSFKY